MTTWTTLILHFVLTTVASYDPNPGDDPVCGVWFAKSTIPGAGLGLFAGKDFQAAESLLSTGDVVISVVDGKFHRSKKYNFLWDDYTWDGASLYMEREGLSPSSSVASPGFGAAVNCFLDLVNVKEGMPQNSNTGLHRSKDPGSGAFSYFWNRETKATTTIKAGNELFASYGEGWFLTREDIGPVPLTGDLTIGNTLIQKYFKLVQLLLPNVKETLLNELWETFVWKTPWLDTSRSIFAIPKSWDELRLANNLTLQQMKRNQHSVSLQWLQENGECGDWITVRQSTIRQAGRGAFAKRSFRIGDIVAPIPLIHLPYRDVLDMFELYWDNSTSAYKVNRQIKKHTQLLGNYCMGHNQSTMLLCPYGTLSNHINHNQTLANVKLVWADPEKSNHHSEWLNMSVEELNEEENAGLSMNLVATREIHPDEEIFLDYGDEWEEAWWNHVKKYTPGSGSEFYKSAEQLNNEVMTIRTEFELLFNPYPENIVLGWSLAFQNPRNLWIKHWEKNTLGEYMRKEDEYFADVEVLRREVDENGDVWYTVIPLNDGTKEKKPLKPKIVRNVPRQAFRFFDKAYTSDMLQQWSFRHDIRVPDDLFPMTWRNRILDQDLNPPGIE